MDEEMRKWIYVTETQNDLNPIKGCQFTRIPQ